MNDCLSKLLLNILLYVRKLREWGLPGVVTFVRNHLRDRRFRRILLQNARRYPLEPASGVTIVADLSANTSFSKVVRDLCHALKHAGIPYQTFDLNVQPSIGTDDVASVLTPASDFRVLRYKDVLEMMDSPFPRELPVRVATIAFWEFESAFVDAYPYMLGKRCLVGMSDFNVRYFRHALPSSIDVRHILYPFRMPECALDPVRATRRRYGMEENDFVVFFNFDYASSFGRKNPDGCIRAFARAFADDPSAKLVFKTMRASSHPEDVKKVRDLAGELGVSSQIVSVDEYLSDAELLSLTNACDVYLSLHRGEGFGLGIAEAMSLGKPVVVTDWSAPTEFCKDGCSFRVPYEIVKVPEEMKDHINFATLENWAEPDIEAAARMLRSLFADAALREKMGHMAKVSIADQFSTQRFRHSVVEFMSRP